MDERDGNEMLDYGKLHKVLFDEAVGDEEPVVETSTLTRQTDEGTISQTRKRQRPNVALAMKLLENQIGGPQDFC